MELALQRNGLGVGFNLAGRPKKFLTSLMSAISAGVVMALLMVAIGGCAGQQKLTTVQVVTQVNAYLPSVVSAADTVAATAAALAPTEAALIAVGDTAFDTLAQTLQALCTAYLANPSATTLQQIQTAINTLEADANTATMGALRITNSVHQQLAIAALKGLLTVLTIVFGMIASTESTAQLRQLRDTNTIHLAKLRPYMDAPLLQQAAQAQGVDVNRAFVQAEAFGF